MTLAPINWNTVIFRTCIFIAAAVAGLPVYGITVNLCILMGVMPETLSGYTLSMQTTYVYAASILFGFVALFIKPDWRWGLVCAPVYAPSVFALFYILLH